MKRILAIVVILLIVAFMWCENVNAQEMSKEELIKELQMMKERIEALEHIRGKYETDDCRDLVTEQIAISF